MLPHPLLVLFDLDGTLVDTVDLLLASFRHAFAGRERRPAEADWIAGIGTPLVAQLRPWAEDEADLERLVQAYRGYQRAHLESGTRPYPGVRQVLAMLRERGHPTAIVTSKGDDMARLSVRAAGIAAAFDTIVGCDSCTRHKPDPEPVRVALERLGYGPQEAVFVGDSPHDIHSGNAAGVATVAALWGPFGREALAPAGPAHWLERIEELPALLDRLSAERAA